MRTVYSVIAWIIGGGVVVQAASIAFGFGGMMSYVQDGGVVDTALVESNQATYTGDIGFWIHAIVGGMVIPLAALLLLIVSFFVKARGARMWAAIVLGTVALQVAVAYSIVDLPYLGLIHGANALAVLIAAVVAAVLVPRRASIRAEEPASDVLAA